MSDLRVIAVALALPLVSFLTAASENEDPCRPAENHDERPATPAARPLDGYTILVVDPVNVSDSVDRKEFEPGWEVALHKGMIRQLRKKKVFPEIIDRVSVSAATREEPVPAAGQTARTKRAVLTSTVVFYDKGSRAARFLVGLGAGAAKTRMLFVVKDLDTEVDLLRLQREGKYAGWLSSTGGTNEEAIMESGGDVVDRLIEQLRRNR